MAFDGVIAKRPVKHGVHPRRSVHRPMTSEPLSEARPEDASDAPPLEVSTLQGVLAIILIVVGTILTVARFIHDLT